MSRSVALARSITVTALLASTTATQLTCAADGRASAVRIGTVEERIGGPKALAEIGDYLLENDKIRVIIHGPGPNRANTVFAGSLIDADLQRPLGSRERGNDQLQELFPAFAFEAMDPNSFEITRSGADGGEAVVTLEGTGGDLFQMAALLNTGLLFPQNLRFRVDYILRPGDQYVTIETTVINDSGAIHPLPFLDPPDLRELGLDIPGLDELTLSTPFGHYLIIGGEQSPFLPGRLGYDVKFGIPSLLDDSPGLPAFPGAVADFFASSGDGVSYGLTVPSGPDNYVNTFRDLYEQAQPVVDYSLVASFFFAGTVGVYHTNPPRELQPGEEFTYTTYFVVGNGDIGSVADVVYDIHGVETGTFRGTVYDDQTLAPVEGASVVVQNEDGHYVNQFSSDAQGEFRGNLPPGRYGYTVVKRDRTLQIGGSVDIATNRTSFKWIESPAPGRVGIQVVDEDGRKLPCKLTLVGRFDEENLGQDPRTFLYNLALGEGHRETAFDETRNEFIENRWYSPDGIFDITVRPGTYDVVVSRGHEYDIHQESNVTIASGAFIDRQITIRHSVNTAGYIAIDTHLHAVNSPDSGMTLEDRVVSIAGEGIEYAAATDHNAVTDYLPSIAKMGLDDWLVSSTGVEVTTFEMGHFNGFPLRYDSSSVRGGDIEWAGFDPGTIFQSLRDRGKFGPEETLVQVNHPRWESLGYFNVYNLDQDEGDVVGLSGVSAVFAPFAPEFALELFSWDFDLVEVINGKRQDAVHSYRVPEVLPEPPLPPPEEIPPAGEILRGANGDVAFPGVLEDWFSLLNVGRRFVGVGASDSHSADEEAGAPRSLVWVGAGKDAPGTFSERDVVRGLRSRRVIMTTGPIAEMWINDSPIGSDVEDPDGTIDIAIRAQVPNWMQLDRAVIYGNGRALLEIPIDPGTRSFETTRQLTVDRDTWFVLEVTGPSNHFPVTSPKEFRSTTPLEILNSLSSSLDLAAFLAPFGNLAPSEAQKVYPQAITNPIWVDVDGGGFDAPGAIEATRSPRRASAIEDVRDAFERIPETVR